MDSVDFESYSKLHGVVSPKATLASHKHSLGEKIGGKLNNTVALP
jgi:hypothetical protein